MTELLHFHPLLRIRSASIGLDKKVESLFQSKERGLAISYVPRPPSGQLLSSHRNHSHISIKTTKCLKLRHPLCSTILYLTPLYDYIPRSFIQNMS